MTKDSPAFEAMTTAEVARRLGVAVPTVHYMVQTGKLKPAHKLAGLRGAYFFHPADVDALARDRARGQATA